jgi:hypothetical protein
MKARIIKVDANLLYNKVRRNDMDSLNVKSLDLSTPSYF